MEYICLGCGQAFEQPVRVAEASGESRLYSPCCREGFSSAVRCSGCGAAVAQGEEVHGLCQDCAGGAVARLREFLGRGFTQAEREVLNDAFDGVDLSESLGGEGGMARGKGGKEGALWRRSQRR